jgi:hypothetical protein
MVGSPSLLLRLTPSLRYLGIHPPDDLYITSSLLNREDECYTRVIDLLSLYAVPDYDIIMTLSAIRTKLPLRLASLHVRDHEDGTHAFDLFSIQCSC